MLFPIPSLKEKKNGFIAKAVNAISGLTNKQSSKPRRAYFQLENKDMQVA